MSAITFQNQKQKVLGIFNQTEQFIQQYPKYSTPELAKNISEAGQYLKNGKLCVVVCGEYKQGKSSLINALLDQVDLFPVDIDITTSAVTTITYGNREKITVVMGDQYRGEQKEITRAEIQDYVTEKRNRNNAKKVKLMVIESPIERLKDGLIIADTPGVGGLNVEHTAVSYAYIPNADVILFVSDAFAPLTTDELTFIQDRIVPFCENIIFVVTKIDRKADYSSIIDSNRQKLSQALSKPPTEILILPVSSELKKVYLQSRHSEDLEDSKFPELEASLWQYLQKQRGFILTFGALTKLYREFSNIYSPLEVEYTAFTQESQEKIALLRGDLEQAQQKINQLLNENSNWRNQLATGLNKLRNSLDEEFRRKINEINTKLNRSYLENEQMLAQPQSIANLLETDIDNLLSQLGSMISEQAAHLQAQIETDCGISLSSQVIFVSSKRADRAILNQPIELSNAMQKGITATRTATYTAGAGAALMGFVGGAIGGALGFVFGGGVGAGPGWTIGQGIGAAIGGVAGAVQGVSDGLNQVKQIDKNKVREILVPFFRDCEILASSSLKTVIDELKDKMEKDLRNIIQNQKEALERSLIAVKDRERMTQEQIKTATAAITAPYQKAKAIGAELENLMQEISAQRPVVESDPDPVEMRATLEPEPFKVTGTAAQSSLHSPQGNHQPQIKGSDYGDFADE